MDALAGYGSSDSSDNDSAAGGGKPKSALSGLLGNLSDASDDDNENTTTSAIVDATATGEDGGPPQKKIRLDDSADIGEKTVSSLPQHVLPPPQVLMSHEAQVKDGDHHVNKNSDTSPFQSIFLSTKDYTSQLRQNLTKQQQSQSSKMSEKQERLAGKLKLLKETIKKDDTTQQSTSFSTSSFASHLKSKQEFGNPHLLKDIIDHFQITPLESTQFRPFEFFDRLQVSEEKARIAAANYAAGTNP